MDESSKAKANSVELMKRIAKFVEFHATAKQLSHILIVFDVKLILTIPIVHIIFPVQ